MTIGLGRRGAISCAKIYSLEADQTFAARLDTIDNTIIERFDEINWSTILEICTVSADSPTAQYSASEFKGGVTTTLKRHAISATNAGTKQPVKRSRRLAGLQPGRQPVRIIPSRAKHFTQKSQ